MKMATKMRLPPEEFMTAQLRLRRPNPEDAEAVFGRWASDPATCRYLTWSPHTDVGESRAHLAGCEARWRDGTEFVWMIEKHEGAELVGSLAARPGVHGVNLGYLIAPAYWGEGFMVEALGPVVRWWLEQPDIYRVWATCDLENQASARVLEKAGFEFEGVLRRWEHHPNAGAGPRDARCYSRVRYGVLTTATKGLR